jgi:hypothetical protein
MSCDAKRRGRTPVAVAHQAEHLARHFWGRQIWPFMPMSSFDCFVFETLIAYVTNSSGVSPGSSAADRLSRLAIRRQVEC